jgi:hypothetical protein
MTEALQWIKEKSQGWLLQQKDSAHAHHLTRWRRRLDFQSRTTYPIAKLKVKIPRRTTMSENMAHPLKTME